MTDWDPHRIATDRGGVKARHVVMATHLPLGQTGLFYAENYPHMHPVIMGRAEPARVPPGMYISVETPRHSMRGHRDDDGQDWMIFTGPSFKHGHVDEERDSFADLEALRRRPFRRDGRLSLDQRGLHADGPCALHRLVLLAAATAYLVATGFNAWGITNGTAAAILIADLIEGRDNPWLEAVRRDPGEAGRRRRRSSPTGTAATAVASGRRLSGAQAARASTSSRPARRRS